MSEIKVASIKSRILAFALDQFLISLIAVSPLTILMMNEEIGDGLIFVVLGLWILIIFTLYFFKDSFKGNSIGKWVVGIGVRDESNMDDIPSIPRLFLRNLLLIIWPIEFLVLATNKDKQRFGDKIANTVVIKTKEMRVWKKIVLVLLAIIISYILLLSIITFSMKNSEAYKTAINYIESNEEFVNETGGIKGYGFMPSGSVQISDGYGESVYTITIKGKDKDIYVEVYLTKEPRQKWIVEDVYYE